MAERPKRPVLRLPPEMRKDLETAREDVDRAKHAIEVLKKLGMDTTELEAKLEWAETARTTLLKEFE